MGINPPGGSSLTTVPGCLDGGHGHSEGRCRGKATWSVLVGQGLPGGQVITGAVHLGARRHARTGQVQPLTGVPQRHQSSPGRNNSCWSTANEPALMSPLTTLELAASRSTDVPDPAGQDQLAEARGMSLDARLHPVRERLTGAVQSVPASGRRASPTGRVGTWVYPHRVCWPAGARLGSASDCWPKMSVGRAGSSP
jgi:hypothetical protein